MSNFLDQSPAWTLFFDGLCEPINPGGVMAYGVILTSPDGDTTPLSGTFDALKENTNNTAEWCALGMGLAWLLKLLVSRTGAPRNVRIFGDSQLVIKQFLGVWRCHTPRLQKLRERCLELAKEITGESGTLSAEWIPREKNEAADQLGRQAYYKQTGKMPPNRSKKGAA